MTKSKTSKLNARSPARRVPGADLLEPTVLLTVADAARNARSVLAEILLGASEAGYQHSEELERRLLAAPADAATVSMVHEALSMVRRALAGGAVPTRKDA